MICIAIAWADSSDGRTVPHGCSSVSSSVNRFAGRWCTPASRELRSAWSHMRARGGIRHGRGAWTAERKPPKTRPSGVGAVARKWRPRITRHHITRAVLRLCRLDCSYYPPPMLHRSCVPSGMDSLETIVRAGRDFKSCHDVVFLADDTIIIKCVSVMEGAYRIYCRVVGKLIKGSFGSICLFD